MTYYIAIALGGGFGAMARYWLTVSSERFNTSQFPVGTFTVNLLGSFVIGLAFVFLAERIQIAEHMRPLIMVGFLGAFTTFSTFSLDAVLLLQQGLVGTAVLYVVASTASCLLAAWIGISLARIIF